MKQSNGYSRAQIVLHWGVVLLLIASYVSHEAMKDSWRALRRGTEASGLGTAVHVWVGVTILVLSLARLALRARYGAPALPEGGNPILDLVAKLTHVALYALIVLIPASGIAAWFGGLSAAGDAHELMFNLLVAVAGLHVAGALYHQFVLRDGLMDRMRKPG
ncbi:MAG: cytochrome b [Defluviimonas sp.]|uniref:cytochrome b n=1 Tax=Albidovulum sp. TaxID=1872424 RepID=UPI001DB43B00|nr:cytochrome b [Paracoccaceae bacterium]MCC0064563.1 cytochrome b [Defluviimonas sp.]